MHDRRGGDPNLNGFRPMSVIGLALNDVRLNVLQNSANERSTSKSGEYQNLKWRFRESKLPIRDLI
jgi:hypothetical protein